MIVNYLLKTVIQDPSVSSGITLSGLAKILALIGTLFAVLNVPSGISQLIGADLGVSSALQSLQTTMIGTNLLSGAARMVGSAAKDAGALGAYGAGRLLGGSSISRQAEAAMGNVSSSLSPLVSDRPVFGGFEGAMDSLSSSSNPGIVDAAAGFVSGGLPNIARVGSEINSSSGSMRDIVSNPGYSGFEKLGRMGVKVTGWGASRAYAAASNRVSNIGRRDYHAQNVPLYKATMMNTGTNQMNMTGGENKWTS